jgi:hypothetical protein
MGPETAIEGRRAGSMVEGLLIMKFEPAPVQVSPLSNDLE